MQSAVCLFLGGSAKIPLLDIKWPIVKGQKWLEKLSLLKRLDCPSIASALVEPYKLKGYSI